MVSGVLSARLPWAARSPKGGGNRGRSEAEAGRPHSGFEQHSKSAEPHLQPAAIPLDNGHVVWYMNL